MTPDEDLTHDARVSHEDEHQEAVADELRDVSTSPLGTLLGQILGPYLEGVAEAIRTNLVQPFQEFLIDIQPTLRQYAEFFEALNEEIQFSERDAYRTLIKYNWLITPYMPAPFLFQVAEIGRRRGNQRKAMNRLFIEHYTNNNYQELVELVESWNTNPLLQKRLKILRDCVAVMQHAKEGKYNAANVVIPTLIAQIDGVLTDFMKTKGLTKQGNRWFDATGNAVKWHKAFDLHTLRDDLFDAGNHVFVKVLFQDALYGQPLKRKTTFSRHKIMHGENMGYGYLAHAIRAFLVLDFLATLS